MIKQIVGTGIALLITTGLYAQQASENTAYQRAVKSLQIIEKLYGVADGKHLFREVYPFDQTYNASYLGDGDNSKKSNPYSYLWPFSGSLSAYTALLEKSNDPEIKKHIDQEVLPGLENYYDKRQPAAYASYVNSAPTSDRFYDDNIWLGIDFADLYLQSKNPAYLAKSKEIWTFVESGMDDKLGGGIYWCEQRKESKNTCSNAPAVVYLLKLYEATQEKKYLTQAVTLYNWTMKNLEDPADHLYWDNINLKGEIQKTKYPYNTGQMIQAGALLYKLTKEEKYLKDAQLSAKSALAYFFYPAENGKDKTANYLVLKKSDNWFIAIMLRGFIELYHQDKNSQYIQAFHSNLEHAWKAMRDKNGLFGTEWTADAKPSDQKWLLNQFSLAEMYARLSQVPDTLK